jgi:hypothetical protein
VCCVVVSRYDVVLNTAPLASVTVTVGAPTAHCINTTTLVHSYVCPFPGATWPHCVAKVMGYLTVIVVCWVWMCLGRYGVSCVSNADCVAARAGHLCLVASLAAPSPSTLVFTPSNWASPQPVTVTPFDDAWVEGTQSLTIAHTLASQDLSFDSVRGLDASTASPHPLTLRSLLPTPSHFAHFLPLPTCRRWVFARRVPVGRALLAWLPSDPPWRSLCWTTT